jgi:hypothetical protein
MNSDAIGAVGEIIGATAVVISLFYLALQVKKQTAEARLSATRELANLFHSVLGTIQEDKEFAPIYLKAIENYDSLPDEQRIRVSILILRGFRVYEQIHLHTQTTVDPDFVKSIDLSYFEWLTFPGIQRWWEVSKDIFEPNFRNHIDTLVEKAKEKGYKSSFKIPVSTA